MFTFLGLSLPGTAPVTVDEPTLIQQAQGDLSKFADLYQRYTNQVYRYLLIRTGNVHEAQDLTSQTFLAAMENLHKYRGDSPFAAWLLGIARNKLNDMFRRQKPQLDLESAFALAVEDQTEEYVEHQLQIQQAAQKLRTISPDRAEAISLRLFAGLEVPEIARLMGKNETAVRMLVMRGLRDLQAQLSPQLSGNVEMGS